jgi:2-polyprenyl-3-methyl-5-hydroxy-6-metoxy-1,4-benzoquinol methylase
MLALTPPSSSPRPATREDVLACYELFLGRAPESPAVIASHLSGERDIWSLISTFYNSPEAVRRRLTQACADISAHQDGRNIEVAAAQEDAERLTTHIAEVWSRYGREEAYFSVLTNPKYLKDHLGIGDIEEFYATGAQEVADFEAVLQRNGIVAERDWTVLELGCGVGRIAEPFARRFRTYIGVDISAEHLGLARNRLAQRVVPNVELLLLSRFLEASPAYDVFFSVIVLQHNPPPIIHQLLDRAVAQLNPGGVAFFQAPCHLYDYAFSVAEYLDGQNRSEHMEMHALPQRVVFELLAKHGLTPIEVTPNARIGPLGFSYGFLARKA